MLICCNGVPFAVKPTVPRIDSQLGHTVCRCICYLLAKNARRVNHERYCDVLPGEVMTGPEATEGDTDVVVLTGGIAALA